MNKKLITSLSLLSCFGFSLVLASCDKSLSEISGISYDSDTGVVSWNSSNAVKTYNLTVNGVKKLINSSDTSYTLAESEMKADDGSVDLEIEGVDEKGKTVEKSIKSIVLLPEMNIEIVDGYFDWTNSTNELESYLKDGYVVKYKAVLNDKELSSLLSDSKYKIPSGQNEFRVKAVFEGNSLYYSNYTSASSKILATPTNINYDGGMLTWKDVDFFNTNVTYKVYSGDIEKEIHSNYIALTDLIDIDSNSFEVSVQAISSEEGIISSEISEKFSYCYLDKIKNVRVENGILTWDKLDGASKYQLEIDGNSVPDYLSENSYVIGGNTSHSYRVRGMSDATLTVSKWSSAVTINTLASPTPYFDGNSAIWSTVHNADSYKINLVKVNSEGEIIEKVLDEESWNSNMFDFDSYCKDVGIYKFSVAACPSDNNKTYSESSYSNELEIVRLGLPTRFRITETSPQKPNGEIMITLSGTNEGAKYTCEINGVTYGATNSNSFTFNKPLESYKASLGTEYSEITLTIKALAASNVAINDKLYLDALDDVHVNLRQLNAPKNFNFVREGNVDYVTWDALEIEDREISYGVLFDSASKSSDESKFAIPNLASGNYSVSVYAKGDILKDYNTINWDSSSSDDPVSKVPNYYKDVTIENDMVIYLTSTYSTVVNIKKLQTPTNIAINSNDGILNWDYVQDAEGYLIYLSYGNGIKELYMAPEANESGIIKTTYAEIDASKISKEANEAGFVVEVYAVGNTRNDLSTSDTYILDSEASTLNHNAVFHVLNATTLRFDNENLVWDKVPYASGYTINNVKRIEEDGSPYVNWSYASTSATSYAWDESHDMEAGTYKICINVEGDFINYFNSDYSNVLVFTKLKTPELLYFLDIDDNAYFIALEEGATEYKVKLAIGTTTQNIRLSVEEERNAGNVCTIEGKEYLKYVPSFANSANPTITIQAIGDNKNYMASNTYQITQTTRELEAPVEPLIKAVYDEQSSLLSISADITNPFNKGYTFYFNGIKGDVVESPNTTYKVGDFANLDISVGYEADLFVFEDGKYIYYYKSQSSTDYTTVYLLANVTITKAPSRNKSADFTVKFNKVTKGQFRYKYEVFDKNGNNVYSSNLVDIGTTDQFVVNLASYSNSDDDYKVVFYIYSIGNKDGTIISNPDALEYSIEI